MVSPSPGLGLAQSSFLTSMEALGYNPLVAIHIALNGKAADILNEHYGQPDPNQG